MLAEYERAMQHAAEMLTDISTDVTVIQHLQTATSQFHTQYFSSLVGDLLCFFFYYFSLHFIYIHSSSGLLSISVGTGNVPPLCNIAWMEKMNHFLIGVFLQSNLVNEFTTLL